MRRDVLSFLEQVSEETGTKIGYKIFQNGEVVAQQYCEKNGPFISFFQKANHLYLYGVRAPVNAFHAKKKNIFIGIRQHLRSLSNVPQELRTKSLDSTGPSLCLWQLRKEKRQRSKEEFPLEFFETLKPGIFFSENLQAVHAQMLKDGLAPCVQLSGLLKV